MFMIFRYIKPHYLLFSFFVILSMNASATGVATKDVNYTQNNYTNVSVHPNNKIKRTITKLILKLTKAGPREKGKGIGWVILGAFVATLLVAFIVFAFAYAGSGTLAVLAAIAGFGLIIF